MANRGMRPGQRPQPWTEQEWAIIRWAEDNGIKASKLRDHLPGRSLINIQNSLSRERKRRLNVCAQCGKKLPEDSTTYRCAACLQEKREQRHRRIREGRCAKCGEPLGPGSSATLCAKDRKYHRGHSNTTRASLPNRGKWRARPAPWPKSHNVLRWLSPRGVGPLVCALPRGRAVVDLFGGSGDISVRAGLMGHDVLAWNDIHPGLAGWMQGLQRHDLTVLSRRCKDRLLTGDPDAVLAEYQDRLREGAFDSIDGASCFYAVSKGVISHDMRNPVMGKFPKPEKGLRARLRRIRGVYADTLILNRDWSGVINGLDCYGVLFLVDAPWAGSSDHYEYDIEEEHDDLVATLLSLEGDFVALYESTRANLDRVQDAPYLYWLKVGLCRALVAASLPLRESDRLIPMDRAAFGV